MFLLCHVLHCTYLPSSEIVYIIPPCCVYSNKSKRTPPSPRPYYCAAKRMIVCIFHTTYLLLPFPQYFQTPAPPPAPLPSNHSHLTSNVHTNPATLTPPPARSSAPHKPGLFARLRNFFVGEDPTYTPTSHFDEDEWDIIELSVLNAAENSVKSMKKEREPSDPDIYFSATDLSEMDTIPLAGRNHLGDRQLAWQQRTTSANSQSNGPSRKYKIKES